MISFLCICVQDIADGFEQPAELETVHAFEHRIFESRNRPRGASPMDDLSLVKAVDGLRHSIVIAAADDVSGPPLKAWLSPLP
jgi:hypothetical protein